MVSPSWRYFISCACDNFLAEDYGCDDLWYLKELRPCTIWHFVRSALLPWLSIWINCKHLSCSCVDLNFNVASKLLGVGRRGEYCINLHWFDQRKDVFFIKSVPSSYQWNDGVFYCSVPSSYIGLTATKYIFFSLCAMWIVSILINSRGRALHVQTY